MIDDVLKFCESLSCLLSHVAQVRGHRDKKWDPKFDVTHDDVGSIIDKHTHTICASATLRYDNGHATLFW
jgi:hypothetical protein